MNVLSLNGSFSRYPPPPVTALSFLWVSLRLTYFCFTFFFRACLFSLRALHGAMRLTYCVYCRVNFFINIFFNCILDGCELRGQSQVVTRTSSSLRLKSWNASGRANALSFETRTLVIVIFSRRNTQPSVVVRPTPSPIVLAVDYFSVQIRQMYAR